MKRFKVLIGPGGSGRHLVQKAEGGVSCRTHDRALFAAVINSQPAGYRPPIFLPVYDPHGAPIPKANGKVAAPPTLTLAGLTAGTSCTIAAVRDTSSAFLQYLSRLEMRIGTPVKLIEKIAFDGSLVIAVNGRPEVTVSSKFGESILVNK